MKKYIDVERLRMEIKIIQKSLEQRDVKFNQIKQIRTNCMIEFCEILNDVITSLQQDETQIDKMLCSQVWWEEQGWIMIPPDATIEGIDSLLRQVKKKLQQNEKSDKRWQPCDEHFRALKYAIEYFKKKKNDTTHLEDLYNGLKKLS